MKNLRGGPSGENRRRRTTGAERARWACEWEASGRSQVEFAREHGLKVATLRRWVREQANGADPGDAPVTLREISLGELLGGRGAPAEGGPWEAEIRLASGVVIAIAPGVAGARVRELVEAVRC